MAEYGQLLNGFTSLDSSVSVSAGGSANGSSKDVGANTSPQALFVESEFSVTQSGTTDQADFVVKVQYSDDNSTWPDDDQGDVVFVWNAASVGADLTRSNAVRFVPKQRYFRFRFSNGNSTDSFTVNSAVGLSTMQDDA